jgi:TonB family protein
MIYPQTPNQLKEARAERKRMWRPVIIAASLCIWIGVFFIFLKPQCDQERIREGGIPAVARVLGIHQTNITINDNPVVEIQLEVHTRDRRVYPAKWRNAMKVANLPSYQPGAIVPLVVDAKDSNKVAFSDTAYSPETYREYLGESEPGEGGTVEVELHLDADGTLLEARVARSSGSKDLDLRAVEAARRNRYFPVKMENGTPIPAWVTLPISVPNTK